MRAVDAFGAFDRLLEDAPGGRRREARSGIAGRIRCLVRGAPGQQLAGRGVRGERSVRRFDLIALDGIDAVAELLCLADGVQVIDEGAAGEAVGVEAVATLILAYRRRRDVAHRAVEGADVKAQLGQ